MVQTHAIAESTLDPRQQRGLQIAATATITRKGSTWLVPSQSGKGRYTVCPDPQTPHCTCPDHQEGGHKCKHIIAVEYVQLRERNADGTTTVTETITVQQSVRKTYPQDWRAYNKAQTHEKEQFLQLLHELCSGVNEPIQQKTGRPRVPVSDAIFAACYKVYSTVSARRFMSDLRAAQSAGLIAKNPDFNTVLRTLGRPELTPVLRAMVTESSLPLKAVEVDFACDSYHSFALGVCTFLFYPSLIYPIKEQELHSGRKRVDIKFTNAGERGFFLNILQANQTRALSVLIECKNYKKEMNNPELDQLAGRFGHQRGFFGMLLCRRMDNRQRIIERCKDTANDGIPACLSKR